MGQRQRRCSAGSHRHHQDQVPPGGRTCVFYDEGAAACRVYTHRAAECRALNCRDTREIEAIYEKDRLTRRDLLEGVSGLWELVADHQQQCAYDLVLPLA